MSEFNSINIVNIVKSMLDNAFVNFPPEKRRIKERAEYYSFACPVCGDSEKHIQKKRGTLYKNTLLYRCWNCDHRSNLLKLSKTYNIDIELGEKLQMIEYVNNAITKKSFKSDDFLSGNLDKLIKLEDLIYFTNNSPKTFITEFKPVQKGSIIYNYLCSRKIFDHSNIYEANYWYNNNWFEPVIVNMNMRDDKILGIQVRNLEKEKHRRLYKIYKFSELYHLVYPDAELDEIEEIGYNKLSYLYGIMDIDLDKPVTVFEGYLDTKFFPNSVGMVGKNTDPTLLLNQDLDIRFFFDYDNAGITKSLEYIKYDLKVFLWEKMFEYWASNLKEYNTVLRKLKKSGITDLNDIAKKIKNPYVKLDLEKWFSIDKFDRIHIKYV